MCLEAAAVVVVQRHSRRHLEHSQRRRDTQHRHRKLQLSRSTCGRHQARKQPYMRTMFPDSRPLGGQVLAEGPGSMFQDRPTCFCSASLRLRLIVLVRPCSRCQMTLWEQ